jgi:hypothetical protein
LFFFFVNSGALTSLTENAAPGFDDKPLIVPACIIFGVTGISRAGVLVTAIQDAPQPREARLSQSSQPGRTRPD